MILSRRRFFGLLAAPAIVRASSIMPISAWTEPYATFTSNGTTFEMVPYGNLFRIRVLGMVSSVPPLHLCKYTQSV